MTLGVFCVGVRMRYRVVKNQGVLEGVTGYRSQIIGATGDLVR